MKCSKAGHIPAKADVDKQATFKENILEPLIKSAQNGECHLFFMNTSHFILDNARYQHREIVKKCGGPIRYSTCLFTTLFSKSKSYRTIMEIR